MRWADTWAARRLDPAHGSVLALLLAANGYDSPTAGGIDEHDWRAFVRGWATRLGISAGATVFDVGCGAGAFLYELHSMGCEVGGIDQSEALVEIAREVMPDASFIVGDASELPLEPPVDLVASASVFLYFPSLDFARDVLERMVGKARRAVLIVDLPDAARRERALAERIRVAGGPAVYAERYDGLEHLYFDRSWVADEMSNLGLKGIVTADQDLPGYGNAPFRFNAWGFKPLPNPLVRGHEH